MLIKNKTLTIYFGDKNDPFISKRYHESEDAFSEIEHQLNAKNSLFLRQVHSTKIYGDVFKKFEHEGDALITNVSGRALGVMTADCLPIVLYDEMHNAIGVVHAGWRGSVNGIVEKTVLRMKEEYATNPSELVVYFGPAAGTCCYEVTEDFREQVKHFDKTLLIERDNKIFFDNGKLNLLQLMALGVKKENINLAYNTCTICSPMYHSHRREPEHGGRQATVAVVGE